MDYRDISDIINNDYDSIEDSVANSLYNIYSTYPGDIPGHPEFGCKVGDYVFNLMDPLSEQLIEEAIR